MTTGYKTIRIERTRDQKAHIFYHGPKGRELPLLDKNGSLYDMTPETRDMSIDEIHGLIERISIACRIPA